MQEENNNISDVTSDGCGSDDTFAALVNGTGVGIGPSTGVIGSSSGGGRVSSTTSSHLITGNGIQLPSENSALGSVGTNSLTLEPTAASSTQEQANSSSFLSRNNNLNSITTNNNRNNTNNSSSLGSCNHNTNGNNSSSESSSIFDDSSTRFLIASNPLLAEKLMAKSLILKTEATTDYKGKYCMSIIIIPECIFINRYLYRLVLIIGGPLCISLI